MIVSIVSPLRADAPMIVRDFTATGSSPDHFDVIAPAYLSHLTDGAPLVCVTYASDDFVMTETHIAAGSRNGRVVGTEIVEYASDCHDTGAYVPTHCDACSDEIGATYHVLPIGSDGRAFICDACAPSYADELQRRADLCPRCDSDYSADMCPCDADLIYEAEWNEGATRSQHYDAVIHFMRAAGIKANAPIIIPDGDDWYVSAKGGTVSIHNPQHN